MKRAIAYLRFSSLTQLQGDSVRRQKRLIDEWLKQHTDYYLDPVTFEDLGLSAWRGEHAARGAFSAFMEAVQRNLIESGSVLLIESLDRLSREKIGDATGRLHAILKAGIDVVTLSDSTHYTRDSLDDPFAIIRAILIAQRANEESEIKSKRMRAAWAEKRREAAQSGRVMTTKCPYWLRVNDARDGFDVLEDRAEVIRQIFRLRLDGLSYGRISRELNERGIENLKGKASQWHSASVERLIKKKSVIGVLQSSRHLIVSGVNEIPGYYPVIIEKEDFERAQLINFEPESRKDSNFNPYLINIFRSLMRCKQCGHSIILSGISAKGYGHYVCAMRRENRCQSAYLRRDLTDHFLISGLLKGASGMFTQQSEADRLSVMASRRDELSGRLQNIITAIEHAQDVAELSMRAKALSAEISQLEREMTLSDGEKNIRAAIPENWINIGDRREWQRLARKTVRIIKVDASAKTCDVYLINGMNIINYPLARPVAWSGIVDAMAWSDEKEIIL
ncbi:recombinase family protein [Pantoea sp. USHLN256]|uniref:recombinase family protein n=1 Tax=Pantoea sp. USHLN256 TaxID=3081293 RepID=UPI0030166F57